MKLIEKRRVYASLTPQLIDSLVAGESLGKVFASSGAVFSADQFLCEAYDLPHPSQLRGEELDVAEHLAVEQAAYVSIWLQLDSPIARRVVGVAETLTIPGGSLNVPAERELPPGLVFSGVRDLAGEVSDSQLIGFYVDDSQAQGFIQDVVQKRKGFAQILDLGADNPALLWFDRSELDLVKDCLTR